MKDFSFISASSPEFIEEMYEQYKNNPKSVDESWREYFKKEEQESLGYEYMYSEKGKRLCKAEACDIKTKEIDVLNLINAYRTRGHLFTLTNPVRTRRRYFPTLDIENFGLTTIDLDKKFRAGKEIGLENATLRDIIVHLEETYCRSVGAEFMFVREPERVKWLQKRMEGTKNVTKFSKEEKKHILKKLTEAVEFEKFLHSKYIGQKRFSLQGGETLIPGLDTVIEHGSELGVEEVLIGMPHRGRLNVLANTVNKGFDEIFEEFEGQSVDDVEYVPSHPNNDFSGDVKYHLGFYNEIETSRKKKVKVGIAPNPSHLEAVDGVVEGMARSKIDHRYQGDKKKVCPILIHGDSAIAGQGVVYEVIQMSLLKGYSTGGTVHLVINNQLGFTTNYLDARSSTYCTDVAKVTLSPVFHVNADDVEAVVHAIQIAIEYRQKFGTDVFIDLLGYRKYGHNEGDEPRFTQPQLYKIIEKHPDPCDIYVKQLESENPEFKTIAEDYKKEFKDRLSSCLEEVRNLEDNNGRSAESFVDQCDLKKRDKIEGFDPIPDTKVSKDKLIEIGKKIFTIPKDLDVFKKVRKIFEDRLSKISDDNQLDWGICEQLAYATLLEEGTPVRLSGQDSVRGTFSHRHASVYCESDESEHILLNGISPNQAKFQVYNSLLSEFGVLGFEYGYSCACPEGMTIWEAQFGDFYNGAQIIIDQFIAVAETKWNRTNGIVLYLPHGYEGQGSEHSSARIERFLNLCAGENMQVANCTTPANFYHLLRAHVKYPFRVPLIVFTPKSLLRHPECVSSLDEVADGGFQRVIDDNSDVEKVKNILFCSGKIYYDLKKTKDSENLDEYAIIRIEQLYPIPIDEMKAIKAKYSNAENFKWIQEEPENFGAWNFINSHIDFMDMKVCSRPESAAPSLGFHKNHAVRQKSIVDAAFDKNLT